MLRIPSVPTGTTPWLGSRAPPGTETPQVKSLSLESDLLATRFPRKEFPCGTRSPKVGAKALRYKIRRPLLGVT